jgi:capsular exopolysaccharide synthesis family protein
MASEAHAPDGHSTGRELIWTPHAQPVLSGQTPLATGHFADAAEEAGEGKLSEYGRLLRARKLTLAAVGLLGAVAGVVAFFAQVRVYRASATLEVQVPNQRFLNRDALDPSGSENGATSREYVETKARILRGDSLLLRTIKTLSQPANGSKPADWAALVGTLPVQAPETEDRLLRAVSRRLSVEIAGESRLIEVAFESTDPQFSATFVNTLTREFLDSEADTNSLAARSTSRALAEQLAELKTRLEKSENALQAYARKAGLLFNERSENLSESRVSQVQADLGQARNERMAKQARYEQVATTSMDALPEVLGDPTIKDLVGRISTLRQELAQLSTTFSAGHYKVKQIRAQIEELEREYTRQRERMVQLIFNDYRSAVRREELLGQSYAASARHLSEQSYRSIQYNMLKREVDTNRQMYESMLHKLLEAGVLSAVRTNHVRVVDPALRPSFPVRPRLAADIGIGLAAGLLLGAIVILARGRPGQNFLRPEDAAAQLGAAELGAIPRCDVYWPAGNGSRRKALSATSSHGFGNQLLRVHSEPSLLSQSCRAVMTSLLFSLRDSGGRSCMVINSPGSTDGKTTATVHLGASLARSGYRTLLIDGDMRRPQLHKIFDVPLEPGLKDLLAGDHAIPYETSVNNLWVLPSGNVETDPIPLLLSMQMPYLLKMLQKSFDIVLIDTPPGMLFADARIWARHANGVIFVVRAGRTSRDDAKAMRRRFAQDQTPVFGVLLNDWKPEYSSKNDYTKPYRAYRASPGRS